MTFGLISDTHIHPAGDGRLPGPVLELFRRFAVGAVLHLGDVQTRRVLDQLGKVAPVLAVQGNNDDASLASLPMRRELRVGSRKLLMVHGHNQGIPARRFVKQLGSGYDCVLYGHSHIPMIEREDGVLFVNPGSATDRRWGPHFGIGVLYVSATEIHPELLLYGQPSELDRLQPLR
jgi:putative phosphoesterase